MLGTTDAAHIDPFGIGVMILGAVALVGSLFCLNWVLSRAIGISLFSRSEYSYGEAREAVAMFADRVEKIRDILMLLEPYTVEYIGVFQSSGWVNMVRMIEDVEFAGMELERRMEARDYDGVVALAEFLCTNDRAECEEFLIDDGEQFSSLVAWEEWMVLSLNGLLDQLRHAAETTRGLGIKHRRDRAPTMFLVEELRRDIEALRLDLEAER